MLKNMEEGFGFLNPIIWAFPDYQSLLLMVQPLVLETRRWPYVGQRTEETRADRVLINVVESQRATCKRELLQSSYRKEIVSG